MKRLVAILLAIGSFSGITWGSIVTSSAAQKPQLNSIAASAFDTAYAAAYAKSDVVVLKADVASSISEASWADSSAKATIASDLQVKINKVTATQTLAASAYHSAFSAAEGVAADAVTAYNKADASESAAKTANVKNKVAANATSLKDKKAASLANVKVISAYAKAAAAAMATKTATIALASANNLYVKASTAANSASAISSKLGDASVAQSVLVYNARAQALLDVLAAYTKTFKLTESQSAPFNAYSKNVAKLIAIFDSAAKISTRTSVLSSQLDQASSSISTQTWATEAFSWTARVLGWQAGVDEANLKLAVWKAAYKSRDSKTLDPINAKISAATLKKNNISASTEKVIAARTEKTNAAYAKISADSAKTTADDNVATSAYDKALSNFNLAYSAAKIALDKALLASRG